MAIDKKIDYVEQDGSLNFVKNSESVTVPKEFKARKEAPAVKLAYITDAEAKMLKKQKPGTPHKGPKGIPSYDSYGSIDSSGRDVGMSGAATSAAETGGGSGADRRELESYISRDQMTSTQLPPGVTKQLPQDIRDYRNAFIAAGGGQRVNPGFFDSRNRVSPIELARARAFNPAAFKAGRRGGIMDLITGGGFLGNLVRGIGQRFGLGKRFNQPTYDMSQFNQLGLMGQVPEDFEDEKISLESFISPEDTIGRVNLNDLEGLSELDFLGRTNLNDYEGILADKGLEVAPGAIIDQGLAVAPGSIINQGIMRLAEVSQKDIDASKARGFKMLDYDTAVSLGLISPNVTEFEFEELKKGNITEPGTYTI